MIRLSIDIRKVAIQFYTMSNCWDNESICTQLSLDEGNEVDLEAKFGATRHGYTQQIAYLDVPGAEAMTTVAVASVSVSATAPGQVAALLQCFCIWTLKSLKKYFRKALGKAGAVKPARKSPLEMAISAALIFCSMFIVSVIDEYVLSTHARGLDLLILTGVYAATAGNP